MKAFWSEGLKQDILVYTDEPDGLRCLELRDILHLQGGLLNSNLVSVCLFEILLEFYYKMVCHWKTHLFTVYFLLLSRLIVIVFGNTAICNCIYIYFSTALIL
jgi:hypothetical protein